MAYQDQIRAAEERLSDARRAVDGGFGSLEDYRRSVGGGSNTGDQWNSAVQQQQQDTQNAMMDQASKDQQAAWDDYSGLVGKANQQAAQTQLSMQNDLDCLMSLAAGNGGVVPKVAQERFNRKFGLDPSKGMGMFSGRYDDKGNFVVQMGTGQMDAQGNPVLQDHVAGPMDQWQMMNRNKAAFSDDVRNQWRKFLSKTYSDVELDKAAGITRPVGAKTETGGTVVSGSWLSGPQRRMPHAGGSSDGRGNVWEWKYNPETGEKTRVQTSAAPWRVVTSRDDYRGKVTTYRSPDGQLVDVKDGDPLPWESDSVKTAHAKANKDAEVARIQAELKALGYDINLQRLAEQSAHNQEMERLQAAKGAGSSNGSQAKPKFNKDEHEALKAYEREIALRLKGKMVNEDGEVVDSDQPLTDDERAELTDELSGIRQRMKEMLGVSGQTAKPAVNAVTPEMLEEAKMVKAQREAAKKAKREADEKAKREAEQRAVDEVED